MSRGPGRDQLRMENAVDNVMKELSIVSTYQNRLDRPMPDDVVQTLSRARRKIGRMLGDDNTRRQYSGEAVGSES